MVQDRMKRKREQRNEGMSKKGGVKEEGGNCGLINNASPLAGVSLLHILSLPLSLCKQLCIQHKSKLMDDEHLIDLRVHTFMYMCCWMVSPG